MQAKAKDRTDYESTLSLKQRLLRKHRIAQSSRRNLL